MGFNILLLLKIYSFFTHLWSKSIGKSYFEDYLRVYPDGIAYNILGFRKRTRASDLKNFVNHLKFYKFAAQFVKDKVTGDLGCGSGYGCELLKKAGASKVFGSDISKHSIKFAKSRYSKFAEFTLQDITNLNKYPGNLFDISISSEVLEHIKEYGKEQAALDEIKRVTKIGGLLIIGVPNNEILDEHGFSYDEITTLFKKAFRKFCIFENALIPTGKNKILWKKRLSQKKTGIIVSELIDFSEIAIDAKKTEIKTGIKPGIYKFGKYKINTKLLHNTHSWVIIAVKES